MEIHPEAASRFDQLGVDLLGRLRPVRKTRPAGRFKPDIYPVFTFTDKDLIGPIKCESAIVNGEGEEVGRVNENLGLSIVGPDYQALKDLAASMQRSNSIGKVASAEYLLDRIWEWVEQSARTGVCIGLAAHINGRLDQDVRDHELWFPLYRVHSEIDLKMGPVKFKTLDGTMMQRWHDSALACVPEDKRQHVNEYYNRLRSKMQGSIAAVAHVRGEPRKAHDDGRRIAQMAVSMLRFVSPANLSPRMRSFCTLLGEEAITRTHLLEIEGGNLILEEQGSPEKGQHAWFIRAEDLALLPPTLLSLLGALAASHKADYARQLYDSLLIYSRNSISGDTSNKLLFILVALESMLLRDENEPIQKNIGERMALIAGTTVEERKAIVANLTEVYKLRSKFVHHGQSAADLEPLYPFMVGAWTCFCNLLGWQDRFATKGDLISWLESRKLSG